MLIQALLKSDAAQLPRLGQNRLLDDALEILARGDAPAVLVEDGAHRLIGLVTEHEVLEALLHEGPECLLMTLRKFVRDDLPAVRATDKVADALAAARAAKADFVVVRDDAGPVGVLAIAALLRAQLAEIRIEQAVLAETAA
jgi:CBS domain-containing protein